MQIFLFFALFIAVLAVIFAIQNTAPTTVSFAVWKYNGSLALVLLISLAAGALISFFFSLPANIKTRLTIRQQRKKMNDMENEMKELRDQLEETQIMVEKLQAPYMPPQPALDTIQSEPSAESDPTVESEPNTTEQKPENEMTQEEQDNQSKSM
jgi:putative membrane protein